MQPSPALRAHWRRAERRQAAARERDGRGAEILHGPAPFLLLFTPPPSLRAHREQLAPLKQLPRERERLEGLRGSRLLPFALTGGGRSVVKQLPVSATGAVLKPCISLRSHRQTSLAQRPFCGER